LATKALISFGPSTPGCALVNLVHLLGAALLVFHPLGGLGSGGVRQVAEEQLMAVAGPGGQQRAFDAHRLHRESRAGVFGRAVSSG